MKQIQFQSVFLLILLAFTIQVKAKKSQNPVPNKFLKSTINSSKKQQKQQRRLKKYTIMSQNTGKETSELSVDSTQIGEITTGKAWLTLEGQKLVLSAEPVESYCAMAVFKDTIMKTGWDTLNMKVSSQCDNKVGYFAIGYLEGLLSYQKIRYLWRNYIGKSYYNVDKYSCNGDDNEKLKKSYALMKKIDAKFKEVIKKVGGQKEYRQSIEQIARLYAQQQGIQRGFNDFAATQSKSFQLTLEMLMIINYDGGIDNVIDMTESKESDSSLFRLMNIKNRLKKNNKMKSHNLSFLDYIRQSLRSKCSVLFKRVGNNDIVLSHSTWDSYWAMQRIFKYLQIGDKKKITYSSYPGCISSTDDFFMLDNNMVVTETSLTFSLSPEDTLHMFSSEYNYIPEYFKIMTANHLSSTALNWIQNVQLFKSAIYYSQWMVFDLNRFEQITATNEVDPKNSCLYVIEDGFDRSPIQEVSADEQLIHKGYYASYNENLVNGQMNTQSKRYTAFENNQKKIDTIDKLKEVMQYNEQLMDDTLYPDINEKQQRLKEKQAYNSIALRFDTLLGQRDGGFGAIDIKVTNSQLIRENTCYAKNGPVKAAGTSYFIWQNPPEGQPKKWKFKWEEMGPCL